MSEESGKPTFNIERGRACKFSTGVNGRQNVITRVGLRIHILHRERDHASLTEQDVLVRTGQFFAFVRPGMKVKVDM